MLIHRIFFLEGISIKELEFDFEALQKYSDPKEGLKDNNPNPADQNKQSSFLKSIRLLWRNVTQAGMFIFFPKHYLVIHFHLK